MILSILYFGVNTIALIGELILYVITFEYLKKKVNNSTCLSMKIKINFILFEISKLKLKLNWSCLAIIFVVNIYNLDVF